MEKEPRWRAGIAHLVPYIAIFISTAAILLSSYVILFPQTRTIVVYNNSNSTGVKLSGYNINSALITPQTSFADSPVITANQQFGHRLTNINAPFNSSALAAINNAPNSYFETAGEMYLNHSIKNTVGAPLVKVPLFVVNGKVSVIYLGSTTCIFCGENRWAMMLALSRFGNFSQLFMGYSAVNDGDIPTVYWAPAHYNYSSTILGSFYTSRYINFLPIEDSNPISGGFSLNPISTIQQRVNSTGNLAYKDALQFIINTKAFQGTPFTIWGAYEVGGADAVVFGNSTPTNSTLPLEYMTHANVLSQLAAPGSQFSWSEYAAADFYIAMVCKTLNNTASVCGLPSIKAIELQPGF